MYGVKRVCSEMQNDRHFLNSSSSGEEDDSAKLIFFLVRISVSLVPFFFKKNCV